MITPIAPPSSTRQIYSGEFAGTRTSGVMPICCAAMQIWHVSPMVSVLCSISTYSVSKPAVLAICAISIVRHSRTVIEATTSSRASFSFMWLRRMSRSSDMAVSPSR